MARSVNATQAKAQLLALLDDVAAGEEVEITRHGRLIARLVPARGGSALRGSAVGIAWARDPNDELLSTEEQWDALLPEEPA
ncbi:MAG: type II toxin-antitoxin system prevent-host-death family antitoxin [Chloroflexota bacterium]